MVTIDKKGDKGNPSNYRLISLIEIITKLYVKYCLHKRYNLRTGKLKKTCYLKSKLDLGLGAPLLITVLCHLREKYTA